ncbi:DUF3311 domain-containing protein [Herbaspirillum rhizosphaerae]|uniref:DUF3311 domain-containing protein n=1 Tax=Herbaspirillum rhizosphaerae TaxID=346179 RepID=A0ABW8Z669_9BURK
MSAVRYLALVPVASVMLGPFFANRVTPFLFGLPFLLSWMALSLAMTSVVMYIVYRFDPRNAPGYVELGEQGE